MGRILAFVAAFFEADEWRTSALQTSSEGLNTGFRGNNGNWTCLPVAVDKHDQMLFYGACPISAPEESRATMAEFLHRTNYGLHIGNCEIDFSDGEIYGA